MATAKISTINAGKMPDEQGRRPIAIISKLANCSCFDEYTNGCYGQCGFPKLAFHFVVVSTNDNNNFILSHMTGSIKWSEDYIHKIVKMYYQRPDDVDIIEFLITDDSRPQLMRFFDGRGKVLPIFRFHLNSAIKDSQISWTRCQAMIATIVNN